MQTDIRQEGSISEWNEGNLFSLRLHEAKEMINYAIINPLGRSPDGNGWMYSLWIAGIDMLFREGYSKYADKELTHVKRVREIISFRLQFRPTHYFIIEDSNDGKKEKFILNQENWNRLKEIVEAYEQTVKFYNDKHGLSTRNRTTEGLF